MIFQDPMTSLNPYLRVSEQIMEPLLIHDKMSHRKALLKAIAALEEHRPDVLFLYGLVESIQAQDIDEARAAWLGRLWQDDPRGAIFGFTTTLDLTALDVLSKNPRYLTRSKSFDTFFSFGPVIVTADEIADVDGRRGLDREDAFREPGHGSREHRTAEKPSAPATLNRA